MKVLQTILLILSLVIFAKAQSTVLTGTIFDWNGAVVMGTKITAKNKAGKVFVGSQNNQGVYSIELPVGYYQIEIISNGFKKFKVKNYQVVKAEKMYLDVVLKVGKVSLIGED